jgi:hypothetical protein
MGVFGRPEPISFITASWSESGRAATREAARCGVLVLGDSQVKSGLQPALIGGRSYNLAVVGGQPAASYHLLDRTLKAGAQPRAVVIGFYPGLLAADLRINTRHWPELLSPAACLGLALTARDRGLVGPLMVHTLTPSVRLRAETRAALALGADPGARSGHDEARAYRRNWRVNAGAHLLPDNPGFVDESPGESGEKAGAAWTCRPVNLAYLRRLIRLAEAHGARVFWLLPTISPGVRAARERDGREAAYLRFVGALQNEFPRLQVLDPRPMLGDPSIFSDTCHLDRHGAALLSAAVAGAIERPPTTRRWIELTAPALGVFPALPDAGLEDVAQSAALLRAAREPAGVARSNDPRWVR